MLRAACQDHQATFGHGKSHGLIPLLNGECIHRPVGVDARNHGLGADPVHRFGLIKVGKYQHATVSVVREIINSDKHGMDVFIDTDSRFLEDGIHGFADVHAFVLHHAFEDIELAIQINMTQHGGLGIKHTKCRFEICAVRGYKGL